MRYNIVYFAFVSSNFGGVEQKIIAQYDALLALGTEVQLFLISKFIPGKVLSSEIEKRKGVDILINSSGSIKNPWSHRKEKFEIISSKLTAFHPKNTIVYLRYPLADLLFLRFLKNNLSFRIITEHQEIENKLRIGIFRFNCTEDILDVLFGKAVRKRITGFVGVSSQFLENQLSYFTSNLRNKKYSLVNGNGIDTSKYHLRKYPYFDGKTLKLLFIGSGFKYQGLQRLLISLEQYYNSTSKVSIIVHVAGVSLEKTYLKKYLHSAIIRESVIFHGFIPPDKIDLLADECHLAINSLNLHQIGINIASTLKSREYFARGIPFVTSSSDDDFNCKNPFILKVKGNSKPFDIQSLIDFTLKLNEDPEHPITMRHYAIKYLDWSVKMKKLIAFFDIIMHTGTTN